MRGAVAVAPAHHLGGQGRQGQQAAQAQQGKRRPDGAGHGHGGHIFSAGLTGHGRVREVHAHLRKLGNKNGQADGVKTPGLSPGKKSGHEFILQLVACFSPGAELRGSFIQKYAFWRIQGAFHAGPPGTKSHCMGFMKYLLKAALAEEWSSLPGRRRGPPTVQWPPGRSRPDQDCTR